MASQPHLTSSLMQHSQPSRHAKREHKRFRRERAPKRCKDASRLFPHTPHDPARLGQWLGPCSPALRAHTRGSSLLLIREQEPRADGRILLCGILRRPQAVGHVRVVRLVVRVRKFAGISRYSSSSASSSRLLGRAPPQCRPPSSRRHRSDTSCGGPARARRSAGSWARRRAPS
eukprot:7390547-Prymnesium_polylepis.1